MAMRRHLLIGTAIALIGAMTLVVPVSQAQRDVGLLEPAEAKAQLERAQSAALAAEARAERLSVEAEVATRAADRTANEAAALAAQVQQAEAEIAAAQARYSIAQNSRADLREQLAQRQQPLVRLTAALQTMAQRPLVLSALQPGSLRETVYVRAVLDGAVPAVRQRTAALRSDLERSAALEQDAAQALAALGDSEQELRDRRASLHELEARQRLASRDAQGGAIRERERALALAEEARDLDGLLVDIDTAASLRRELAALPGPVLRPPRPTVSQVMLDVEPVIDVETVARAPQFLLPVQGRTLTGFGSLRDSGLRSTGITIAPSEGAQVIAPADGRVAFSGPYRGFGRIVIIEHVDGWTSLVTGLARTTVEVGDSLVRGGPLGVAAAVEPIITIELRRDGEPVNPLEYL